MEFDVRHVNNRDGKGAMRHKLVLIGCLSFASLVSAETALAAASEKLPEGAKIVSLEAHPSQIALASSSVSTT